MSADCAGLFAVPERHGESEMWTCMKCGTTRSSKEAFREGCAR